MIEEWRSCLGYEGRYEVSNLGRVRTIRRERVKGGPLKQWVSPKGYLVVFLCNDGSKKTQYVHRLVGLAFGIIESHQEIDHINGNRKDNVPSNLRGATSTQNHGNRRVIPTAKTPYKGVSRGRWGRWRASIKANGQYEHLGRFDTAEQAARAYDEAAIRLFAEYARLNFPRDALAKRGEEGK